MLTGDAAKDNLDVLMKKFTRVTRNWSQNCALHLMRGYIVPGDLQYMRDKRDEAECAAHDLFDVLEEEDDLYNIVLTKTDKVRVELSALYRMPRQSDAPDAALPTVAVPDLPTVEDAKLELLPQEVTQCQVLPELMEDTDPAPDLAKEEVTMSQLVPKVVGARLIIGLPAEETVIAKILVEEDPDDLPKKDEDPENIPDEKDVPTNAKSDEKDVAGLANVPGDSVQKSWSPGSPSIPAWGPSVSSSSQAELTRVQCVSAAGNLFPVLMIGSTNFRNPCGAECQSKQEFLSDRTQQQQQHLPVM